MPIRFYRSTAFETAYNLERQLDRDEEREPSYATRQPIPLVATGTAKALHEKRQAEQFCGPHDDGGRALYTLRDGHGESQQVVVCMKHGELMPLIDGDRVTAEPADPGLLCDFYHDHEKRQAERLQWVPVVKEEK